MSGGIILIIFVVVLVIAARLWLRPERRPPLPTDDDLERSASSQPAADRPTAIVPTITHETRRGKHARDL